MSCRMGRTK